jgi:hypothetical protein
MIGFTGSFTSALIAMICSLVLAAVCLSLARAQAPAVTRMQPELAG